MSEHKSLAAALLAFQQNPPHIELDSRNPHFRSKFAGLPGITKAVKPRLSEEGLVYSQPLDHIDGTPAIRTMLMHPSSGESIESVTPLLLGGKFVSPDKGQTHRWIPPEETDPQVHGSAITYARRYALLSILGLVGDEDDDGNAASAAPSPARTSADTAGAGPPTPSLPAPADDIPFGEPAPAQQTFAAPGDAITDKQKSKIHVVMTKLSEGGVVSVEQFRAHMDATYGVTSTKELTKKQASELIEWLEEKEAA